MNKYNSILIIGGKGSSKKKFVSRIIKTHKNIKKLRAHISKN